MAPTGASMFEQGRGLCRDEWGFPLGNSGISAAADTLSATFMRGGYVKLLQRTGSLEWRVGMICHARNCAIAVECSEAIGGRRCLQLFSPNRQSLGTRVRTIDWGIPPRARRRSREEQTDKDEAAIRVLH
jgi:hypothetical protein